MKKSIIRTMIIISTCAVVKYDNFLPGFIEQILSGVALDYDSVSKFILCSDKAKQLRFGI